MGRLRSIEINNFKSYRGLHSVDFGEFQFVSIIGTNGSGKSNMMDAISFVLGMQSSGLRSSKAHDLVYRPSTSAAEVEDITRNGRHAYVKLIYERGEGDIIELKRSILSNGSSEYRVDNRVVTHAAYLESLAKENIIVKAKNFLVFQGQIEEVAQQSPEELTALIEQISGSAAHKDAYDELKAAVEDAKTRSLEIFNKRKAQHAEVRDFNNQKREADRYKDLVDSREDVQLNLALATAYHLDKAIQDCEKRYGIDSESLDNESDRLELRRSELDASRREFDKARKLYHQNQRQIKGAESQKVDETQQLRPLIKNISSSKDELKRLHHAIEQLQNTEASSTQLFDRKQHELELAESERAELESNNRKTAEISGLNLSVKDEKEYERLESLLLKSTGPQQMQITTLERQKRLVDDSLQEINDKLDQEISKKRELLRESEALRVEKVSASESLNESKEVVSRKEKEMARTRQATKELVEEVNKIQQRHNQIVQELSAYNLSLRESQREKQYREDLGLLRSLMGPAVRGPIYELLTVKEKKYGVALDTVFGKHFHSIVVDSQKVAEECIKHLKEHRRDVKTFIPLDRIVIPQINRSLRQIKDGVRLAIDCVSYSGTLKKAAEFVCGSTLICEDLSSAREVRWGVGDTVQVKIVCLDGSVISKANLITSGPTNAEESRMSRQSESVTRKLKVQYEGELKNYKVKAEELDQSRQALDESLAVANKRVEDARTRYNTLSEQLKSRENEVFECEEKERALNLQKSQFSQQLSKLTDSLSELYAVLDDKRRQIFEAFAQEHSIDDIVAFAKVRNSFVEDSTRQMLNSQKQISALKNEIACERDSLARLKSRMASLKQRLVDEEHRLASFEADKSVLEDKLDSVDISLTEMKEAETALKIDMEKSKATVDKQDEEVQAIMETLKGHQKQLSLLETELYKLRLDRVDILRKCKVEGLVLPLEHGCLDDIPLGDEVDEAEALGENAMDIDEANDNVLNDRELHVLTSSDEIKVDYSSLDHSLKKKDIRNVKAFLARELAEIDSEIEALSFNNNASDHFKSASARYNDLGKQVAESKMNHQKLLSRFEKVQAQRMTKFNEAFRHISGCIGEIYSDLTKSEHTLGGSATLHAQNSSEPYLGGISYNPRPPTKRAYDITQLSGGEKSIAAIALLFAIQSYHKSPFFILDEVDAALDAKNVAIVADYIRKRKSEDFQFIVISLKAGLYQNSDALIGIYRNQDMNSSQTLTLDLQSN